MATPPPVATPPAPTPAAYDYGQPQQSAYPQPAYEPPPFEEPAYGQPPFEQASYEQPPAFAGYQQASPPSQPLGWAPPPHTSWGNHAPDSLLGRTAAKSKNRGGVDPYETETLPIAKLRAIRRRGRIGWLMAVLGFSALAAGISWGLEERQRLLDATARERELTAQAQQTVAAAEQRAKAAEADLASLKAELASQETTSSEDQKLIANLKGQISDKEGEIETAGREVSLSLVDDVMFDSGRAELSLVGYRVLARVGKVLKEVQDKQIMIGGHTDDRPLKRGDFATNWELSAARAVNVARYLVEEVGLAPENVSAAAFSQYRPRSKNAARNRRIEVLLTPVVKVEKQASQ